MSHQLEILSTVLFGLAILHTFSVKRFQHLAKKYKEGSVGENLFHLLGEIEVVFGIWAGIFILYFLLSQGTQAGIEYLNSRNFTEPLFVFVIMAVCSTRPILDVAEKLVIGVSNLLPLPKGLSFYLVALILTPLLGSFITEPAAMTITALLLLDQVYKKGISDKLKYATLGLLFVNISIGGTLTPYAAPPVLMVAATWGWDLSFMLTHFGFKSTFSIFISSITIAMMFRREISQIKIQTLRGHKIPLWVSILHLLFLIGIVLSAHHPVLFMGLFLFFLGLFTVTNEYQAELKLKESLLVGFFLAGLVVIGGPQRWWLEPLLSSLNDLTLYFGAMALTAVTDNAALTYLGSLVPGLSDAAKYALVSGSVIGGGLTVIANAPNPAGYGILNSSFGNEGISPLRLFVSALFPTAVAAIVFLVL